MCCYKGGRGVYTTKVNRGLNWYKSKGHLLSNDRLEYDKNLYVLHPLKDLILFSDMLVLSFIYTVTDASRVGANIRR
jgi:hypothetical protein